MEIFSEIYGCYYSVVGQILNLSHKIGVTRDQIEDYVHENAFYDTAFQLLPKLFSNEWSLLHRNETTFCSKLHNPYERPMSNLEKAWLCTLLNDHRIGLFLDKDEIIHLQKSLGTIEPIFDNANFHIYDMAADGDDYHDENYKKHFQFILLACKNSTPICIEYENSQGARNFQHVVPWKISYSQRDDKFRLLAGVAVNYKFDLKPITLNISRIQSVSFSDRKVPHDVSVKKLFRESSFGEPILLKISHERNAIERCMIQFASWEKQTEYNKNDQCYYCRIFYDPAEETELLIRILSFGPVVQVLGPPNFLSQVRLRIRKQFELMSLEKVTS